MKAILRLKFEKEEIIQCFDHIISDRDIYGFIDVCERHYGICTDKSVDFYYQAWHDNLDEYKERQELYYNMVSIALPYMKSYFDDLLFYDKISIFLAPADEKVQYIWIVNEHYTKLYAIYDSIIPENVKDYVCYDINNESRAYKIYIKFNVFLPLEQTELKTCKLR